MIRRVVLRRFKRFDEVTFDLPGHVVLAGPNNTGKTTLLQAIAAWSFGLRRWKQLNDFQRHGGAYTKAPIARPSFTPVPVRTFDLLWRERDYRGAMVVEVQGADGWTLPIEFIADSTEQVHVRPLASAEPALLRSTDLDCVFVPPMTGLSIDEPVYQRPKIDQLLATAKPGDVLRNLIAEASKSSDAWDELAASIERLFGYRLIPPDDSGAHIIAEYEHRNGKRFDVLSAGSGFQQVLMLLTFLHTRPGSVLLIDEPDAHLHVYLQDAIFGELQSVAARRKSKLVIATHSEVIIDSVDASELIVLLDKPRPLGSDDEKRRLIRSLGILTNTEVMQAIDAPGILYVEGPTDLAILRAWAKALEHAAQRLLEPHLFWRKKVSENREGGSGSSAREHYDALKLLRADLPGVEIVDRDARPEIRQTGFTEGGLQRLRWRRYEIESYLVHPDALARFCEQRAGGPDAGKASAQAVLDYVHDNYPPAFSRDPLGDHDFLANVKARTTTLPHILTAGGLPAFPYQHYHEIAAVMKPEEIHSEVREKLDLICKAFGR